MASCEKDWYDEYILNGETMKIYIVGDTHFNHQNMQTYCQRPPNFTEIIQKRWHETVKDDDTVIHLGDFTISNELVEEFAPG